MKNYWILRHGALLYTNFIVILSTLLFFPAASDGTSNCAVVKIEIRQELTLERQGFDAHMKISNGLPDRRLENVNVEITFQDEDGNTVMASSDPDNTAARFFIRPDSDGITASSKSTWNVEPIGASSSSDLHWLIIPAPGSAEGLKKGKIYYVGAALSYSLGGEQQTMEVSPDYIFVKPLPKIVLDYFLTKNVFGDDAFTDAIEPPVPFALGVRLKNTGSNTAYNLKIDSAQPEIVENEQGLLIGFEIRNSQVNGKPAKNSLLADFGDIEPGTAAVGRWTMACSLSGEFTEFEAEVSHSDELGGELTSLIKEKDVHTHLLVKDVIVDLPGRDAIHDFLARQSGVLKVFESDCVDSEVADLSRDSDMVFLESSGSCFTYDVFTPAVPGFIYLKLSDPHYGNKILSQASRSDGKQIKSSNAWLSRERKENPEDGWKYFLNLFDANTTGEYIFRFTDPAAGNMAPVLQFIPDKNRAVGQQLSFLVEAGDPDGTVPEISVSNLPATAFFTDNGDGTAIFDWTPQSGQTGIYTLVFTASDSQLEDQQTVTITIYSPDDTDSDGMPNNWERQHFGDLSRDGTGDYDGDGITDLYEYLLGTDPTAADHAPTAPIIAKPDDGAAVESQSPVLTILNSSYADGDEILYDYQLYSDASYSQLVDKAENISGGKNETDWPVAKTLADNTWYYWRVRAYDGAARSLWAYGRFFVNTENDPPGDFEISQPADNMGTDSLKPRLEITNSIDPDNETVFYEFEICSDPDMTVQVASGSGISPEKGATTSWEPEINLENGETYYWRATAIDKQGASTQAWVSSFFVNTALPAPEAPNVKYPAPGSVVSSQDVSLEVSNSDAQNGNRLSYYFELDNEKTFNSGSKIQSPEISEGQESTVWDVFRLDDDTRYYWRAKACNGEMESAWVYGSFLVSTINNAPSMPVIKNPGKGAWVGGTRPKLAMHEAVDPEEDNVGYTFELCSDEACQNTLARQEADSPVFIPQKELDNNTLYYWRVLAADEHGQSTGWTETARFFVRQTGPGLAIHAAPDTVILTGEAFSLTPVVEGAYDDETLTFSIINRPGWAEFDLLTGKLSGTPGTWDTGTTSHIVITVTNSSGQSVSVKPFDLTVINENDLPYIRGKPDTVVLSGSAYSFSPVAEAAADAVPVTFTITNQPGWAEFDPDTGRLSGTPSSGDLGITTGIVITATDSNGARASLAPFDIAVKDTAETPIAVADSYDLREDTQLLVNAPGVLENDIIPDSEGVFTAIMVSDATHGSLILNEDGSFFYIPAKDYSGNDSFTYLASDKNVSTSPVPVSFHISPVNDIPEISQIRNCTVMKNNIITGLDFSISDVETPAESLEVSVSTDNPELIPKQGMIISGSGAGRSLTLIPEKNQHGRAALTITVVDEDGRSATESFMVRVLPTASALNGVYLLLME